MAAVRGRTALAAHESPPSYASPLQRTQESAAPWAERVRPPDPHRGAPHRADQPVRGQAHEQAHARRTPSTGPHAQPRPSRAGASRSPRSRRGCSPRCATPTSAPSVGEVVMVSHQLPIWMVHRAVAGKRLAHDPRARRCALSSITSFAWQRRRVHRDRLSGSRGRLAAKSHRPRSRVTSPARRPPTPTPPPHRCRSGTLGVLVALAGCTSGRGDQLAEHYREGTGQGYISGDGAYTVIAARRARGEPIASRDAPLDAGRNDLDRRPRRPGLRRQLLVRRLPAVPRRGRRPRGAVPGVHRPSRAARACPSSASTSRDRAAQSLAFAEEFGVTYPSILDVETGTVRLAFAGTWRRRRPRRRSSSMPRAALPRASPASSPSRRRYAP